MKKIMMSAALGLLLFAGCSRGGEFYSIKTYAEDSNFKVVTMKTYDPASEEFQFRFDKNVWTIEEWPEEEAVNHVALVHKGYEDGSCFILPGTMGKGTPEGAWVYDGSLLTSKYAARTVEIVSGAGIRLLYAVGFEVEGVPYIFEINFPLKDQDDCEIDAQLVINTFSMVNEPVVEEASPPSDESTEAVSEEAAETVEAEEVVEEAPIE